MDRNDEKKTMRLQKYIAEAGIASRRKAEEMITAARVKVNGIVVTEMGYKVNSDTDRVEVDAKPVCIERRKVYIALNKPEGYVTTVSDQFGRPTVLDLLHGVQERVYPVGRLDYDTSGLLLLTNDGDFTYRVTHPAHEMDKVYLAEVMGWFTEKELYHFKSGIMIEDYFTSPAGIRVVKKTERTSTVEITIHEGRNRQVRKMCRALGHDVIMLKRIRIGPVELKGLEEGQWRYLDSSEVSTMFSLTGIKSLL